MSDDWDLYAVVRSCSSSATSSSCASTVDAFVPLPDPKPTVSFERRDEDLTDLFKPFLTNLKPVVQPVVPFSSMSVLGDIPKESIVVPKAVVPPLQLPIKRQLGSGVGLSGVATPSPRTKRRKVQMKRVCQVAADDLSSDTWSWRKYGQKPIKGSPYPRGYYKCSTSKGCPARKQVERNRTDPGMFIVTYTSEHNHAMPAHRNSLSGITRVKPEGPTANATATDPTAEKVENEELKEDFFEVEDEEDEFLGSDMALGDDFFEGLEGFGDCMTNLFPSNNEAAAPGGGG